MKVVAFLPAKGTSERIKNKNLESLDGKPLFIYTLEKLIRYDFLDEVYLDTESVEIMEIAKETGCKFIHRSKELASNATDGHQLMYNEAQHVDADIYVQVLCTSPFIKEETIRKGIEILKNHKQYDSVVLVKKEKQYTWKDYQPTYDKQNIPNSTDLPETIIETMGLYIARKEVVLNTKKRFGETPYLLEAEPVEAIDVNYPQEFELANLIASGIREEENRLQRSLCSVLNSPMLSDIMDDLDLNTVINGMSLNISGKKVLGRAKTLKLRGLRKGEDYRGIYDALHSYATVRDGDIIVVENESSSFAYFGELNANLAIRSGAVGAVIGGVTRDTKEVKALDFPVFSLGNKCKDVRKRATVESINKEIQLFGVRITPGDLIFGDSDGIVVIPKAYEKKVIERALQTIEKEKNVISNIVANVDAYEIVSKVGEF